MFLTFLSASPMRALVSVSMGYPIKACCQPSFRLVPWELPSQFQWATPLKPVCFQPSFWLVPWALWSLVLRPAPTPGRSPRTARYSHLRTSFIIRLHWDDVALWSSNQNVDGSNPAFLNETGGRICPAGLYTFEDREGLQTNFSYNLMIWEKKIIVSEDFVKEYIFHRKQHCGTNQIRIQLNI